MNARIVVLLLCLVCSVAFLILATGLLISPQFVFEGTQSWVLAMSAPFGTPPLYAFALLMIVSFTVFLVGAVAAFALFERTWAADFPRLSAAAGVGLIAVVLSASGSVGYLAISSFFTGPSAPAFQTASGVVSSIEEVVPKSPVAARLRAALQSPAAWSADEEWLVQLPPLADLETGLPALERVARLGDAARLNPAIKSIVNRVVHTGLMTRDDRIAIAKAALDADGVDANAVALAMQ